MDLGKPAQPPPLRGNVGHGRRRRAPRSRHQDFTSPVGQLGRGDGHGGGRAGTRFCRGAPKPGGVRRAWH